MLETRTKVEYRYFVLSLPKDDAKGGQRVAVVMSDSRDKIIEYYEREVRSMSSEGYKGDSALEGYFRPYPSTLSIFIDEIWTGNYEAIVRAEVPVKLIEW